MTPVFGRGYAPGDPFLSPLTNPRPLLVAGGIDLASVKAAMGNSRITRADRYLRARPAGELADRFTRAVTGASTPVVA